MAARRKPRSLEFHTGDLLDLGFADALNAQDREQVRGTNFEYVRQAGLRSVEANVVYAVAEREGAA